MKIWRELKNWIKRIDRESGYVCDACGKEIFDYPLHRLCEECAAKLHRNDGKTCPKCGRKTISDGVCLTCKRKLPEFAFGFSPFEYNGTTAALINRIKNGNPTLAYFFGAEMAECILSRCDGLSDFAFDGNDIVEPQNSVLIVPVPMSGVDLLERGYNQSEELAQVVFSVFQARGYAAELDTGVLIKRKETRSQKQLSYAERAENVAGAFHVQKRLSCRNRVVLLIDDILTTGATGNECAARLYGAGAKEVLFLTAASLAEQK